MFLIVSYKKPYSDIILDIMRDYSLYEEDDLLKNIEKIIPISKLLKGKNEKKLTHISYELNGNGINFNLDF